MDERGARLSHGGVGCPQPSCLLFALPSDRGNSHLLWDWEAVGHGGRRQHRVDRVRHSSWVTERLAGSLGVWFPWVMVAWSLVQRALGPRGGCSVSDDRGGHADRHAVTKLVARHWVQKRDSWGGQLPRGGGVRYRNWLMFVSHGVWCEARCLVFTAPRVRTGLVQLGVRRRGLRQTVRRQVGLETNKKKTSILMIGSKYCKLLIEETKRSTWASWGAVTTGEGTAAKSVLDGLSK